MPVIGRPREFERDAALQGAMQVFWRKGFLATSMSDLCEAMGIRSPSLYAAFGSKEALYLEAVGLYAATIGSTVWTRLSQGRTARASIRNFMLSAVETLPACGLTPAGCMVALAGLGEEVPGPVTDTVRAIRLDCLALLKERMRAGVTTGEIKSTAEADRLARFYMSVFQGMAVQARDGASAADLKAVVDAAMGAWPTPRVS